VALTPSILQLSMRATRKPALCAALLLPVVLFSVVWTNFALWRCQFDGLARSECCCPKGASGDDTGQDSTEAPTAPTMAPAQCCDVEQHLVDRAPAQAARSSTAQLAEAITAALALIPAGFLDDLGPPLEDQDPAAPRPDDDGPPRGRSILAQKQALLI
jgi:hypothetical protein